MSKFGKSLLCLKCNIIRKPVTIPGLNVNMYPAWECPVCGSECRRASDSVRSSIIYGIRNGSRLYEDMVHDACKVQIGGWET